MLKKVYELYWTSTDQAMQHYSCLFANETSGSVETIQHRHCKCARHILILVMYKQACNDVGEDCIREGVYLRR
jgi:hypothetical protein